MADNGVKSTTLKSYFSAIKNVLLKDGYPWNDQKVLLNALVKGCKIKNDVIKTRLPIQKKLLELLLFETERHFGGKHKNSQAPQPYLEILYKAIFSIMYYGMMRVGEVASGSHPVRACDIHIGSNKNKIMLVLYTSKTHSWESKPQKIKISAVKNKGKQKIRFFCPFEILRTFLKVRGPYETDEEPFFVFRDRSPIQPGQVLKTLRDLLKNLNLRSEFYSTHSLRAGRSVDMEIFSYSISEIKTAGRWRSSAVYKYLKY